MAVLAYLAFRAQFGGDAWIRLQAAQHERLEDALQAVCRAASRILAYGARESLLEILSLAEEAGIQELLERPEVVRAVLDRRAR